MIFFLHIFTDETADVSTQVVTKEDPDELDTIEQTRVAVQALQDIANDFQYVTTSQGTPMNTTIQNVTLNSGRMIQVVVQGPDMTQQQVIVDQQEPMIEEVQQIEIDNSVESIIPISGAAEEVVETETVEEIVQNT